MVALSSLPYPIATFITHKAQIRPRTILVQCSVRVPVSPSRRIRRKNYLRPKILKTLTKPYPGLKLEDVETPVESYEPIVGGSEGGFEEIQAVRDAKGTGLVGFKGVSSRMMFRVVASFVGLFILQTVVSVWMMDFGDSDENDRSLGVEGLYGKELGLNGSIVVGGSGSYIVDEDKIDEIRKMARAVREAERRKKNLEDYGTDLEDVSDDEEDLDADNDSSIRSGIAKEIDGKLTKLRKRSLSPLLNVDFFDKLGASGTEAKDEGGGGNEEDDRLLFEAKRKFRSKLITPGDKPKGFQSGAGVKETNGNMKNEKQKMSNIGMRKVESVSQGSTPLQVSMNRAERKSDDAIHGSTTLRSVDKSGKGIGEGARLETGVAQKYSNGNISKEGAKLKESNLMASQDLNLNDLEASAASNMRTMKRRNGQQDSENFKSIVSGSPDQDKKHNDSPYLWRSTLPCVFVILMQKGHGNEAQQGFYTIQIKSETDYLSSYIVAFEDQNDAKNFSYILDSVFEDLPNAAVDVALLSTKELREITETLDKRVIVARKGELKLYAGQPLADAENALKSIAK